jgi:hypothetical protein
MKRNVAFATLAFFGDSPFAPLKGFYLKANGGFSPLNQDSWEKRQKIFQKIFLVNKYFFLLN